VVEYVLHFVRGAVSGRTENPWEENLEGGEKRKTGPRKSQFSYRKPEQISHTKSPCQSPSKESKPHDLGGGGKRGVAKKRGASWRRTEP